MMVMKLIKGVLATNQMIQFHLLSSKERLKLVGIPEQVDL